MKFRLYFSFSLFLFVGLQSCNEKIDLVGNYKETAVVYGLLDQADSIHLLKITRAFIGPGNALEIAKIADSSYFKKVDGVVTELVNGVETRSWTLRDTLIENKDPNGVFYAPTQKVYYFATTQSAALNQNATYKLHLSINDGAFEVDGKTALVKGISSSAAGQTFQYEFAKNLNDYTNNSIPVVAGTAHVVNTTLQINLDEYTSATDKTSKSFLWKLGEIPTTANSSIPNSFQMNGKTFYTLLAQNSTNNPSIIKRNIRSIKLIITGGSEDFYNYITINQPTSSIAQTKTTFTNLTATKNHTVVGLFAARYTLMSEKLYYNVAFPNFRLMTNKSVLEMCKGQVSGGSLFCSQHPYDLTTTYSCQ